MHKEYQANMDLAASCEQVIRRFRKDDDPTDQPHRLNFASKAQRDWLEVVNSYQKAFDIYSGFDKRTEAKALCYDLFDLVRTCDMSTSSFAIALLLTLKNSHQWINRIGFDSQNQLKIALKAAIHQNFLHNEMDIWLLRSALNLLRDLADDDSERQIVDISWCETLELGAKVSSRIAHLDNAKAWYLEAAKVAQDRLGNAKWASDLLQMSDSIQQIRTKRASNPASIQVMQSVTHSSPGYVEAMGQMGITEDMQVLLSKDLQEQHRERFLPSLEQLMADYESEENRLYKLLADERFILNRSEIEERAVKKHPGMGLLEQLPGKFVDSQGNSRGDFNATERFAKQYVDEVVESIGTLFATWQRKGYLVESHITYLLRQFGSYYDWRIYEVGLSRYFQSDFLSTVHIIVPQFEHIVRTSVQDAGVNIKQFKGGIPGTVLLNDLINPDNIEIRELLGEGLFDLIYWYLVNSNSPFGYRHKIAHGWIRPEECNLHLSAMTIWLTLKVVSSMAKSKAA